MKIRATRIEMPLVPADVAAIMLLAVGLRIFAAWYWWADTQTDPDVYVALARELALGDGFCIPGTSQPTAYRPPGYPLFLMSLMTVNGFEHGLAIPVWNILFDLMTIGLVWNWLRRMSPYWVPRIAATIIACDPLMIRYAPLPMTESCFTYWSIAAVLLLSNVVDGQLRISAPIERGMWGVAGGLLGMAALCRPSIWPLIVLVVIVALLRTAIRPAARRLWRSRLAGLAYFCFFLSLLVGPWFTRNLLVFREPILTTTHGGYTLLLGNNPVFYNEVARKPWGTTWAGDSLARWQRNIQLQMDAELGTRASDLQRDRWMSARAWKNIAADPAGFLQAAWYRFRSFWSLTPRGANSILPPFIRGTVGIWYAGLFLTALFGAFELWKRRLPGGWVLVAFVASLQLLHLIYWTDTRMRMPVQPLLAICAALFCENCLQHLQQSVARRRTAVEKSPVD